MKAKTRALLVIFVLLAAQLACAGPLPGQNSQLGGPVNTFTSVPAFPTSTETPLPTRTPTVTSSPRPTRTPFPTEPPPPTLTPVPSATLSPTPELRSVAPVVARYLSSPPRIDGDWSEWKDVTNEYPANFVVWGRNHWTGPEDLSASFHLGWDDKYLYLAIKVRDDVYVQNATGANLYNGDSLELLLDTQLTEDFQSTQLTDDDFQLGLSPGRPHIGTGQEAYLWAPNWLAGKQKTVQIEARRESGMYRVEAAIPWTVFQMEPVAGQHYGFGLSVSDNDNGDGGVQQSMVSNLPDRNPGDPTTWGDLTLER